MLDIAVVLILIIYSISGWRKGLVLSAFGMLQYILSGIAAKYYSPRLSNYILNNTNMINIVKNFIGDRIQNMAQETMTYDGATINKTIFKALNLPSQLEKILMEGNLITRHSAKTMGGLNDIISDALAKTLMDLISFVAVFFAAMIVLSIISRIIDNIVSLPVLNEVNSFGGMIFGSIKGLILIFISLTLLTFLIGLVNNNMILKYLEESTITKFLYNHNPIFIIINSIFNT